MTLTPGWALIWVNFDPIQEMRPKIEGGHSFARQCHAPSDGRQVTNACTQTLVLSVTFCTSSPTCSTNTILKLTKPATNMCEKKVMKICIHPLSPRRSQPSNHNTPQQMCRRIRTLVANAESGESAQYHRRGNFHGENNSHIKFSR